MGMFAVFTQVRCLPKILQHVLDALTESYPRDPFHLQLLQQTAPGWNRPHFTGVSSRSWDIFGQIEGVDGEDERQDRAGQEDEGMDRANVSYKRAGSRHQDCTGAYHAETLSSGVAINESIMTSQVRLSASVFQIRFGTSLQPHINYNSTCEPQL